MGEYQLKYLSNLLEVLLLPSVFPEAEDMLAGCGDGVVDDQSVQSLVKFLSAK